jgi:formate hydrogenlyase subunit 4
MFIIFLLLPADSPMNYNGNEVLVGDVRVKILAMAAIWFWVAAYLGPQLRKGRAKARDIAFGVFVVSAVIDVVVTAMEYRNTPGVLVTVIVMFTWNSFWCAICAWYLYRKPNVRAFFGGNSTSVVEVA